MTKKFEMRFWEKGLGGIYEYIALSHFNQIMSITGTIGYHFIVDGVESNHTDHFIRGHAGFLGRILDFEEEMGWTAGESINIHMEKEGENVRIKLFNYREDKVISQITIPLKDFIREILESYRYLFSRLSEYEIFEGDKKLNEIKYELIPAIEKKYFPEGYESAYEIKHWNIDELTRIFVHLGQNSRAKETGVVDYEVLIRDDKLVFNQTADVLLNDVSKKLKEFRESNSSSVSLALDKESEFILKENNVVVKDKEGNEIHRCELSDYDMERLIHKVRNFLEFLDYYINVTDNDVE